MRLPRAAAALAENTRALGADRRGAVLVEYAALIGIGLLVAAALATAGAAEVTSYSNARAILSTENP